jgi:Delta3-Delta2-enoyl-CoA isomerase
MIELDRDGDVRILRLRAGENRFNRGTVDAIHDALDEVEATTGPVALVTVGEGKFFSNGLDLDWMGTEGAADPSFLDDVHRLLLRTLMIDVITVAAINGHAFAGGAMFATAHDYRLMREDRGYWCLPEVDLGLPLTPEMFAVLDAHLPRAALADAALTGNRYGAVTAAEIGLINGTAAADQLLGDAVSLARRYVTKDRRVIAAHKELLHGRTGADRDGGNR